MNRLVLIGNGFDLAHGLKTSYEDFINWYWEQRVNHFAYEHSRLSNDILCSFESNNKDKWDWHVWYMYSFESYLRKGATGKDIIGGILEAKDIIKVTFSPFFERIYKSIETNNWVDIENEYYELLKKYALEEKSLEKVNELNSQLHFLQEKLVEYLSDVEIDEKQVRKEIRQKIYTPLEISDISVTGYNALCEHVINGLKLDNRTWDAKLQPYGSMCYTSGRVDEYREKHTEGEDIDWELVPKELLLPNQIMLLNFNYTNTAEQYLKKGHIFSINQIHGNVEHPKSVIFGYGDELDEDYKKISNQNDNILLGNIKSIKYLESDNYRKVLSFIESEPYQILIMGHSCGNSDRTLLNTIFEHKNCVSIKPYFYKKDDGTDNYLELVQNISRNFTDMKLMRDRVVNKTYTETLTN